MISPVSQIEAVVRATEAAGGLATLAQLYHDARQIEGSNWSGTQNPFANIRRIVQTSKRFWRVRPGLWALKSHEERLRKQLELPLDAAPAFVDEWDHGYYQGLLLEIGRFDTFQTTIPAQDKNRRFVQTPLQELATLQYPPIFTFEHLMRFAQTIDVGWYNARGFPHSFFEVEHSTDIQNSLLKFIEFQDLRTRFVIVADAARKREWEDKMKRQAFVVLRERVEFWDYERVSKLHAHSAERATF